MSLVLPVALSRLTYSPTAQRLMSGPSSMPSGQAHVYLGEWSVICGAFRQRYSHPPLGRLPMLQASGAGGTEAGSADDPTRLPVTLRPFNRTVNLMTVKINKMTFRHDITFSSV